MKKRVKSLLLVLCMLITMIPTTFLADEVTGKITCVDHTGEIVEGAEITITLWDFNADEELSVIIANSTSGVVEFEVEMNETYDGFIYNQTEYEEIEVSYVLPEGYENANGETEDAYWQYADVWFEEPVYELNVISVQKDEETPMTKETYTCAAISDVGEFVPGAEIKAFLCNSMGEEADRTVIATGSNGQLVYDIEYKNNRFWYEDEVYAYIGYNCTLPEGFQFEDGSISVECFNEPSGIYDIEWYVDDLSYEPDDDFVEDLYTYDMIVEKDEYYIEKAFYSGKLSSTLIVFNDELEYNEKLLMEAMSYVTKEDLAYVYLNSLTDVFPTISRTVMKEMAEKEIGFQINKNDSLDAIYVEKVTNTDEFGVEFIINNNKAIIKKLSDAGISKGYVQFEIIGSNFKEDFNVTKELLETGILSISEENYNNSLFENKYIYLYDEARDIFVLEEAAHASYAESEWLDPVIGIMCYVSGNYIVSDQLLPDSLTNATVGTEIKTDEVIEKDVLEDAKESGESVNVQVEASEKSSFVNWLFEKIETVVDFIPTVQVDAIIDEVENRVDEFKESANIKYTTVSFDFDGVLPGKAEVTLDIKNSTLGKEDVKEGQAVYLYYFNPTEKEFELVDTSMIRNGFATFGMTHCSDYIITLEELPASVKDTTPNIDTNTNTNTNTEPIPEPDITAPDTGDDTFGFVYVAIFFAGVAIIVNEVLLKRKVR